jgi:hypothetical protein
MSHWSAGCSPEILQKPQATEIRGLPGEKEPLERKGSGYASIMTSLTGSAVVERADGPSQSLK